MSNRTARKAQSTRQTGGEIRGAGIKAVKLYAWEAPFERRINHLRWLELEQIRQELRLLRPLPVPMTSMCSSLANAALRHKAVHALTSDHCSFAFAITVLRLTCQSLDTWSLQWTALWLGCGC